MSDRTGRTRSDLGQSMIEVALVLPFLLLVLAAALEVGKYFNDYLTLLDSTREAARFSADNDYLNTDQVWTCSTTDFYLAAACLVQQNMHEMSYDHAHDDIVVSVVTIVSGHIQTRYPDPNVNQRDTFHSNGGDPQNGWSYCRNAEPNQPSPASCTPASSLFNNAALEARIAQDSSGASSNARPTAWVVVEIFHLHNQFLGLIPPGLPFLPQQVMMHAYTIMPIASAAPSG